MISKLRTRVEKGFTLIELMIVVAIIGILAAVAVPAYQEYITRSQVSEAVSLMGSGKTPFAEYYADKGIWPASTAEVMGNTSGKYALAVDITGTPVTAAPGSITLQATMRPSGINPSITSGTVQLITADGGKNWTCTGAGSSAIQARFLPAACR
jgi:type IV pilus assembly protein PilA